LIVPILVKTASSERLRAHRLRISPFSSERKPAWQHDSIRTINRSHRYIPLSRRMGC
jgi:hypothetical protein